MAPGFTLYAMTDVSPGLEPRWRRRSHPATATALRLHTNNASVTVAAPGTLQIDGTGLTFSQTLSLAGTLADINGSNTWSGQISTLAVTSTINVAAGQSLTLNGVIGGAGALTVNKSGSGTLIVTGTNTYTGATTTDAGIVLVENKSALVALWAQRR